MIFRDIELIYDKLISAGASIEAEKGNIFASKKHDMPILHIWQTVQKMIF